MRRDSTASDAENWEEPHMPMTTNRFQPVLAAMAGLAACALLATAATAQTYGIATMQPGTLSHTSASAIATVAISGASSA